MKLIRLQAVKAVLGHRSDATIYTQITEGVFPRGVSIGKRSKAWPDYEVLAVARATVAGATILELQSLVQKLTADRANLTNGLGVAA